MKEALLWHKEGENIRCDLCGRRCLIPENGKGVCLVRKNIKGKLFSLNYGKLVAVNVDPIEKKPLFHFYPRSKALSVASASCNFMCKYCFEPSTRIFTSKGLITLRELFNSSKSNKLGDGFVSFPTDYLTITHEGKVSKITKVYKHIYNGEMIVIKPYYLPEIKATPSHEFFILDRKDGKIKKVPASNLNTNHLLLLPKLKINGNSSAVLDLKKVLSTYQTEYRKRTKIDEEKIKKIMQLHKLGKPSREIGKIVRMHPTYIRKLIGKMKRKGISRDLLYGENEIVERNGKIKFKTGKTFVRRYIYLNEDLASLFGYYCAEGSVIKNPKRLLSYKLVFSFGRHETRLIERTKNLIYNVFGIEPRIIRRRTTTTVELGNSLVALLFKEMCGNGSHRKRVPQIILSCEDRKVIYSFLKAYLEGDGYQRKNILIECCTSSEELAFGVYFLFFKLGLLPSFYKFLPQGKEVIEGRIVNRLPFFRIKIHSREVANTFFNGFDLENPPKIKRYGLKENEDYYFIKIRKIYKQRYSGYVYNLEVEDNSHSYLPNFVSACNCCNYEISQVFRDTKEEVVGEDYSPKEIVEIAKLQGCKSISYTYTEPTVFFEFAFDTAKLAHKEKIKNTFVTNGYMTPEAVKIIAPYLDAATVDFKGSADPKCYKELSSVPSVQPIFDCLLEMKRQKIHIEITDLIIPKYGDNFDYFKKLVIWIKENLGEDTPFHILRFFPTYKIHDIPETPVRVLEKFAEEAKKNLNYVYLGNVPGHKFENTYCPNCGSLLIERIGFASNVVGLEEKKCKKCGKQINIII
jgi:pyruvate formate lyase activating enzyme